MPCTSTVLPPPRGPRSRITSPARTAPPRRWPSARVSSADLVRSCRATSGSDAGAKMLVPNGGWQDLPTVAAHADAVALIENSDYAGRYLRRGEPLAGARHAVELTGEEELIVLTSTDQLQPRFRPGRTHAVRHRDRDFIDDQSGGAAHRPGTRLSPKQAGCVDKKTVADVDGDANPVLHKLVCRAQTRLGAAQTMHPAGSLLGVSQRPPHEANTCSRRTE